MNLTEAIVYIKKGFRYFLLALVAIVILWFVIILLVSLYNRVFNQTKPDYAFGSLPTPTIPSVTTSKGLTFTLDTTTGQLPILPTVLPVYQFSSISTDLLNADQATQLASTLGFTSNPTVIDNQTDQFENPNMPSQRLVINVATKNFSIINDFTNPVLSTTAPTSSSSQLIVEARSILKNDNLLPTELANSNAAVSYFTVAGNSITPASSVGSANFAKVDIFPANINSYPVVGPIFNQALVNVLIGTITQNQDTVVQLNYTYWPLSGNRGLYPTLPVSQAYRDLQNGKASLISPTTVNFSQVNIQSISIGYYEDVNYQQYLEPVYLFDGIANTQNGSQVNVRFYLPAINPSNFH